MDHFKKDMMYFGLFMLALFIGWILTGGPQAARQSGSDQDKFQRPLAPISSGETYDQSLKEASPIKIKIIKEESTY